MVGWTLVMIGIMLIGIVVVCKWTPRQAGHTASWQQARAVEQRKGEAASQLPASLERCHTMDHAKARVARIDGELSRLTGSQGSVGHHASAARASTPR
jgi:hypothetical protein